MDQDTLKREDFKKLDTFYASYGFSHYRFIVKEVGENGVIATMPDWCKSSGTFLSYTDLSCDKAFIKSKPYSKLRWRLKF